MVHSGEVHEGMTVRTSNGRKVGRVAAVGDVHFELEHGLVPIPRREYLVEFRDVDSVRGGDLYLVREDHPLLELEHDDDGSNLPPREFGAMELEPVPLADLESPDRDDPTRRH